MVLTTAAMLGFSAAVMAADTTAAPATQPTTAPATQPAADVTLQASKLIEKLGDPDAQVREKAAAQLKKMGKPALTALKEQADNPDIEVASRVKELIETIENPPKPVAVNPAGQQQIVFGGGQGQVTIHIQTRVVAGGGAAGGNVVQVVGGDAGSVTTVQRDGKTTTVTEGKEGIQMTVTEQQDGKDVTKTYKAKDAEDLKKKDAEAYKLYDSVKGNGEMHLQLNVTGNAQPQPATKPAE
jgi:hypothetical protein